LVLVEVDGELLVGLADLAVDLAEDDLRRDTASS
jgi:hypothetical protein